MSPVTRNGDGGRTGRGVRFEFLELRYGRLARRVEFGDLDRPFVILGGNGAGKSTLIEGIVRTLYGFRRILKDDRLAHERRRPWDGGEYRATLGVRGLEGRITVERDFETDEVRVRVDGRDATVFEGEANPSRSGETIRRYRHLLRRHVGLPELEAYERTACVHQGDLFGTALGQDLLRVAAGGHADVESATTRLLDEYHRLTLEPVAEGETRRRKPGDREKLAARVDELETRAREARSAEERRAPLVRMRDEKRERAAALHEEVERLEAALERVSELERWSAVADASRDRVHQLEGVAHELDEALARLQ
ncbi:MAG: AAA family ATPase, partial [Gemmatimonadota bacterium]